MKTKFIMGHHLNEEIYNKSIDDFREKYNSQKGRRFVEHLIKSFLPVNPLSRIYEFGDEIEKNCCITGFRLASVKEIINTARLTGVDESYISSMDIICTEEGDRVYTEAIDEYNKINRNKIYKNIREKDYAFSSDTSSRVLSTEALLALEKFAEEEIKNGNKSIKFLLDRNKRTINPKPIVDDRKTYQSRSRRDDESNKTQFNSFDDLLSLKKRMERYEGKGIRK